MNAETAEAIRLERCNGCGKPRSEWGPVCGGMLQGDATHYHSSSYWYSAEGTRARDDAISLLRPRPVPEEQP